MTFPENEQMDYQTLKLTMTTARGQLVRLLDDAMAAGTLLQKERDILYRRLIDWNSLEKVGKEFGVTRERIRQIEAKAEEKLRLAVPSSNA